eukprot:scaffold8400_cov213-Skeletonema_marinoi.AAC.6
MAGKKPGTTESMLLLREEADIYKPVQSSSFQESSLGSVVLPNNGHDKDLLCSLCVHFLLPRATKG